MNDFLCPCLLFGQASSLAKGYLTLCKSSSVPHSQDYLQNLVFWWSFGKRRKAATPIGLQDVGIGFNRHVIQKMDREQEEM